MNRKAVVYIVGQIVRLEAAMLLLPFLVALLYRESCALALAITMALALVVGTLLTLLRPKNLVIYAKEGFVTVALSWILLSLIGALPFVISREIPSYVDAFFETVSGFTTTGASILTDVEAMSHGLLFWRSFTHWIGGMGILVLVVAILPAASGRPIHILRAEMTGPQVGKLVPKARDTAKILYLMYIALTILEIIFLLCGNMPLFDSVLHAVGTAGTGGFGIKADSLAGYSPYLQWVIAVFMFLFGINFNLYYLVLLRRFRTVARNKELLCYVLMVVAAVVLVMISIHPLYPNFGVSLRQAFFQVSSVVTTTGYSTADFNAWPTLAKAVLFLLMFVGGCAGSTAGGLKVSRIMILFKSVCSDLRHMLHPRSVSAVQMEGKKLDRQVLNNVTSYFALYFGLFALLFLIISFEPFNLETNLSAVNACFNNIGPGFGGVGPMSSFSAYSAFSKVVLSIAMLLGRLELYPVLFTLSPSVWTEKQ